MIKRPKRQGKKTYILIFDLNKGKFKEDSNGKLVLNPIEKIPCVSIIDAHIKLTKYLKPKDIPPYHKCVEISIENGFIGLTLLHNGKHILND